MKSVNTKVNKITNFNTRFNSQLVALVALFALTSFAPHNSWAGGTGKAAQQVGQATARLNTSLNTSVTRQTQATLMRLRLQSLQTRIVGNMAQASTAQINRNLAVQPFSGARQTVTRGTRITAPRGATGLMSPRPAYSGSVLTRSPLTKPMGTRAFSSSNMITNNNQALEIDNFQNLARRLGSEAKKSSPLLLKSAENIKDLLEKLPEQIRTAQETDINRLSSWQNEPLSAYRDQKYFDAISPVQQLLLELFETEQNRYVTKPYGLTSSLAGAYAREIEKIAGANQPFNIDTLISQLQIIYSEKKDIPINSISQGNTYFLSILATSAHTNPKATIESLVAYAALKASTPHDNPILFFASTGIASPEMQSFFDQETAANEQRKKEYALQHLQRPMTLSELQLYPWENKETRQESLEQAAEKFKKYQLNGLWIAPEKIKPTNSQSTGR